eukprot:GHVU01103750.1.p2 GENE.GHVU01103750.1~~GHVU01103750.1.p2  ORF type:complete len:157 (+),score=34.61 GHVU01103750.1:229-699(+)
MAAADKNCRVYVGNLAWKVKWQDLKDHMRKCGEVRRVDIFDDGNGKSKGCGIVVYEVPESATRAIQELTDTELCETELSTLEPHLAREEEAAEETTTPAPAEEEDIRTARRHPAGFTTTNPLWGKEEDKAALDLSATRRGDKFSFRICRTGQLGNS